MFDVGFNVFLFLMENDVVEVLVLIRYFFFLEIDVGWVKLYIGNFYYVVKSIFVIVYVFLKICLIEYCK